MRSPLAAQVAGGFLVFQGTTRLGETGNVQSKRETPTIEKRRVARGSRRQPRETRHSNEDLQMGAHVARLDVRRVDNVGTNACSTGETDCAGSKGKSR